MASSESDGQAADANDNIFNRYGTALSQERVQLRQHPQKSSRDRVRVGDGKPKRNKAGPVIAADCQQCLQVQILGHEQPVLLSCQFQNLAVGRIGWQNCRDPCRNPAFLAQRLHRLRRDVHIGQQTYKLHFGPLRRHHLYLA